MSKVLLGLLTLVGCVLPPGAPPPQVPYTTTPRAATSPFDGTYRQHQGQLQLRVSPSGEVTGVFRGRDDRGEMVWSFAGRVTGERAAGTYRMSATDPGASFEAWFEDGNLVLILHRSRFVLVRDGAGANERLAALDREARARAEAQAEAEAEAEAETIAEAEALPEARPAAPAPRPPPAPEPPAPEPPPAPPPPPAPKIVLPKDRGDLASITGCYATYRNVNAGTMQMYLATNVHFDGKGNANLRTYMNGVDQKSNSRGRMERTDVAVAPDPDDGQYVLKGNELTVYWNDGKHTTYIISWEGKAIGMMRAKHNGAGYVRC